MEITVAWLDPVESSAHAELGLAAQQVEVIDLVGNATLIRDGDDGTVDGQVRVPVSGRPRYFLSGKEAVLCALCVIHASQRWDTCAFALIPASR